MMNKERRQSRRVSLHAAVQPQAEIRTNQNHALSATVINLSHHGALLEIDRRQCPSLRVDEKVSVKIRLSHDVVWLAGTVRHSYARRLGIFFPAGVGRLLSKPNVSISQTLPRAMHRRPPQEILQAI